MYLAVRGCLFWFKVSEKSRCRCRQGKGGDESSVLFGMVVTRFAAQKVENAYLVRGETLVLIGHPCEMASASPRRSTRASSHTKASFLGRVAVGWVRCSSGTRAGGEKTTPGGWIYGLRELHCNRFVSSSSSWLPGRNI